MLFIVLTVAKIAKTALRGKFIITNSMVISNKNCQHGRDGIIVIYMAETVTWSEQFIYIQAEFD